MPRGLSLPPLEMRHKWRMNNALGRTLNDQGDCCSNFSYTLMKGYEIPERRPANSQADDFD
jgi:hypothetical protein